MVDDTRLLSRSIALGMVIVGLLIVAMIWVQLNAHVIPAHYFPAAVFFAYLSNLIVSPALLYAATRNAYFKMPALAWVHITMSMMVIYFSEVYSPFTPAWSILILVASTYYGWQGFVWSSFVLVVTAIIYILQFPLNFSQYGGPLEYSILAALVVTVTVSMSYLFVRVITNSQRQNRELQKAQQSEQLQITRITTLLNSISDPVLTLNRYGHITSQNAAAQAFFDTNESLIGREVDKLMELKDGDGNPASVRLMIDAITASTVRDDLRVGKGRATRHLSFQMSRIRSTFGDGEEYGVVLIIRDVTQQKTLEEEKDEFISVVSHELRTPVAIAEGSLSNFMIMQERHVQESKLHDAADEAYKQVIFLAQMINDLSTLSRAERGVGSELETINVNDMMQRLYTRYEPEASTKKLQLNLDVTPNLPPVATSRLYLEEILQNFITNSIKYTREGSVMMSAKLTEGKLRFAVSDTGIGMTKTDLQHIFEKFYRSEDYRTRETSGTGLGLYVVGKLAAKLGTKIEVDTRLNHGSTFAITIPAAAAAAPATAPEDATSAHVETPAPVEAPAAAEQPAVKTMATEKIPETAEEPVAIEAGAEEQNAPAVEAKEKPAVAETPAKEPAAPAEKPSASGKKPAAKPAAKEAVKPAAKPAAKPAEKSTPVPV